MMKLKKNQQKKLKKHNLSQLKLTCQSHNPSHVTGITSLKAI
jgi:hypothetical protein